MYAMKVVDSEVLKMKKKTERAETERRIMRMLDHPFLPNLYAEFEASQFSCVVMEYCSGGDLHSLRYRQPNKRFSISSARYLIFFALFFGSLLMVNFKKLTDLLVYVYILKHILLTISVKGKYPSSKTWISGDS